MCYATPDLQITHFWRSTLTPKGLENKAEVHSMLGNLSSNLVTTLACGWLFPKHLHHSKGSSYAKRKAHF